MRIRPIRDEQCVYKGKTRRGEMRIILKDLCLLINVASVALDRHQSFEDEEEKAEADEFTQ
jgi:hypothetical protein